MFLRPKESVIITKVTIDDHKDEHPMVAEVRINYKSGGYIQSWFSRFDVKYSSRGNITSIVCDIASVHPDSENKITVPLYIGAKNIESVWVMQRMRESELYSKSQNAI